MPFVYQGRLHRGRPDGPAAALRLGERALAEATLGRRVDLRLTWDGPEPFAPCAELLPADFAGYWVDIAAAADPRRLDALIALAATLGGGRLALACTTRDRENEVALDLPGPAPLHLDAEPLDPLRAHLHVDRLRVAYLEGGERATTPERRRLAAGRTRAAHARLAELVDGALLPYPAVFLDDPRLPPADPRWLDAPPAPERAWFTGPAAVPPPLPAAAVQPKPEIDDGTPWGLTVTLPADAAAHRLALWRRWIGLLDGIDLVLLRCMGPLAAIRAVLDTFDLHHRHPHRPHQTFGICTVHHPAPLPFAAIEALAGSPATNEPLVEWDLRWSALELSLDGATTGAEGSFYVMRHERGQLYDALQLCLDGDDPGAAALRFARRQLAARFGRTLDQPSAWQYVGPALDSPRGRRYAALAAGLADDAAAVVAAAPPIDGDTPRPPGLAGRFVERLTGGGGDVDLVTAFEAALAPRLPGFRHDRRAHLTDRYFVELTRATPGGHHLIQLRRLHAPSGFRVSVGASRHPLPLADLDPGVGRAAPGWATPLAALVPERPSLDWTWTGAASAQRAIEDAAQVLAARAGPFFEAAEARLMRFGEEEEA